MIAEFWSGFCWMWGALTAITLAGVASFIILVIIERVGR